jgi:MFS family permease
MSLAAQTLHGFIARHRFLLGFVLLSLLAGISVGLAKVTTSLYALSLHATPLGFGLIAGAQSVGILFMSLPMGVLVDQFGPGRLFRLGSVAVGLIYLAVPAVDALAWLLATTALVSFVMPLRFVSLNTVFMQQLQTVGEAKAGWFRGSHMLGMFLIGPGLAASLVAWAGFAASYWLIGLSFITAVLLAPLVFRCGVYQRQPGRRLSLAELRQQLSLLRDEAALRQLALYDFVGGACHMYYSFFIVAIAIQGFGLGATEAAGLITVLGACFIATLFLAGSLLARWGEARFYLAGFALALLGLLALGLARWAPLLWLGGGLLGLGLGVQQVGNLARYARLGRTLGGGRIAGLMALIGPAGSVLGSVAGGLLGGLLGLQTLFLCLLPCFALFAWQQRPRRQAVFI